MNPFLPIILVAIIATYLIEALADVLNIRSASPDMPREFADYYDGDTYRRSQQYLRDTTKCSMVAEGAHTAALLLLILSGGFQIVDGFVRQFNMGPIVTGLLFTGILVFGFACLRLPFNVYRTFVIEERYDFNRTTPRTFLLDLMKSTVLLVMLGGAVYAVVLWFFGRMGKPAWLYCWGTVVGVQIFTVFISPYVILPLFNKFEPVDDESLKAAIREYAASQRLPLQGVFRMDGSRRSSKSNAFFTGFGRSRRIVLFDTLIARHTIPELLCIVAHETGHYKKHHISKALLRSVFTTGLTFFLLSLFMKNALLFEAFKMEQLSVYASLFFFGILYTPIAFAIGIAENTISRKQEYAADLFAARTTGSKETMKTALKKLSVDNLANLTPHPMKVWLSYSHPPILQRIQRIQGLPE